MAHAPEKLEHAHHVAHGGGHDSGPLSTRVGITMAVLGVVLAFAAAKVGGERTELVGALVGQQHAHANYQAQDIKHRVAILSLQNLHAEAEVARTGAADMLAMARAADRYLHESDVAKIWVDAFDPLIEARTESQEDYEQGQLAAELGIVIASIALLLKRRLPWLVALALGVVALAQMGRTYAHTAHRVHDAEAKIEAAEKAFDETRAAGKTTDTDQALVDEVKRAYGTPPSPSPSPSPPSPSPAKATAPPY
jgi:Domain of unknown function (DUF4337)